ncbi:MAG: FAD:protein FMN transferase [Gammaproteobacteria bacterium]|nr:FAD:protein FMN transferase [Gammaproteobacteria bacterium]
MPKGSFLFAAACCTLLACGAPKNGLVSFSGSAMGTVWTVQITDLRRDLSHGALERRIIATLDEVDQAMSTYKEDSEVMKFNRQISTDWFPISPPVAAVLREALVISQLSNGAFDITVSPLVNLWGFGPTGARTQRPPTAEIRSARAQTGYENLEVRLSPPAMRKKVAKLSIDLSAIAKGYAVDRISALLDENGSKNYLVEIGGELRAMGNNPQDEPWRIGVERPDADSPQIEQILPLRNLGMATSGDYRNFFEEDGKRYSHTIDPNTGEPVTHSLASVSVLADSVMRADGLATALLVLGPRAGAELAEREEIAALFIERKADTYKLTMSSTLQQYLGDAD